MKCFEIVPNKACSNKFRAHLMCPKCHEYKTRDCTSDIAICLLNR